MRRFMLFLTPLLLAGCVNDSASYYQNGSDHAVTVRAEQEYFWADDAALYVTLSNLPDCQRRLPLAHEPATEFEVALYQVADNTFVLRSPKGAWQVETATCSMLGAPAKDLAGEKLGSYKIVDDKMVFEPATAAKR